MRALAGIEAPEDPPAAPGGLMFNTGTFDTSVPPSNGDERHFPESVQADLLGWPRPAVPQSCGAPPRGVKACGCEVAIIRDHCDALPCSHPYCEERNRTRRGMDAFDILEAGRDGRNVIYFVGTVPPDLRAKYAQEKEWRKLLRRLVDRLKKDFSFDYGVERSDPAGEDGVTWHPHVNLLFVRKDRRGYIDQDLIRDVWKDLLYGHEVREIRRATNAGEISLEESLLRLVEHEARPVNFHLEYSDDLAKIRFWCDYLGRPWPRWAEGHKYMLRVKWFGNRPTRPEREKDHKCPRCGLKVYTLQLGSEEAAHQLATMGYARIRDECEDRQRHFARSRPAKFQKFTARVSADGTTWSPEV